MVFLIVQKTLQNVDKIPFYNSGNGGSSSGGSTGGGGGGGTIHVPGGVNTGPSCSVH